MNKIQQRVNLNKIKALKKTRNEYDSKQIPIIYTSAIENPT